MALPNIHTIGYENAVIEDLISTLKAAGVTRVIDVREAPYSKRPEFSTDTLAATLANYGVAYTHIRELGNPPAGREALRVGHPAVFREIIAAHLDSERGQNGLARALALAAAEPVCLLCMEKAPRHCHRSLVAARLNERSGQEIVHLHVTAKAPHPDQAAFDF
jgi:uncharacterized protein (DUF488 family)